MDAPNFENAPRDYALALIEDGLVSESTMVMACLKFLSPQDVRTMRDANELSPRFFPSEDV